MGEKERGHELGKGAEIARVSRQVINVTAIIWIKVKTNLFRTAGPLGCNPLHWTLPIEPVNLHDGADQCFRSKPRIGGGLLASQQCCYDEDGDLLRWDPPNGHFNIGAGTPDFQFPYLRPVGHLHEDVCPGYWAEHVGKPLDYFKYRPPSNGGGVC